MNNKGDASMNKSKSAKRLKEFFKEIKDYVQNNPDINFEKIYNVLSIYHLPEEERNVDLQAVKNSVTETVCANLRANANVGSFNVISQGEYFNHINVIFRGNLRSGLRDVVKIYLPVVNYELGAVAMRVYKFLNINGIGYYSKIAGYGRLDNFIVRVHSVEEAKKLIDFCNESADIKKHIRLSNPFVPEEKGFGVARDTYGISYNAVVARELSNFIQGCIDNNKINDIDLKGFYKFLIKRESLFNQEDNLEKGSGYHFCLKELINNIDVMRKNKSPLQQMEKETTIIFDKDYFYSFTSQVDYNGSYYYESTDGQIITKGQYEWYKLQAMKFCYELYVYKYKRTPDTSFILNRAILSEVKRNFDQVNDDSSKRVECAIIPCELLEQEPLMNELYASLYVIIGVESRGLSQEQAEAMGRFVKNKVTFYTVLDAVDPLEDTVSINKLLKVKKRY